MTDLYSMSPREIAYALRERTLTKGLVPFVKSSPGIGKSTIILNIAKEFNLFPIDHRLSTSQPEDLSGYPKVSDTSAKFVPFDLFPTEDTPIPEGYDGWMLFFDEFNSAKRDVQAACYKTILDKRVGQYKLHPHVVIACAGNLDTDKAITNDLSTAMQSRIVTLEMRLDHQQWLEDVAITQGYDERIIAYLNFNKDDLCNFRPDHDDVTFACPRTWEFVNKAYYGEPIEERDAPIIRGMISGGIASNFINFTKVHKNIAKVPDILKDPEGHMIPQARNELWATIAHMGANTTEKNFGALATYASRIGKNDLTFEVLYFRMVMIRHPNLFTHPQFAQAMIKLDRYLKGSPYGPDSN